MNRKYINYAIFLAIVASVIGLAVRHSRHMAALVSAMAGEDSKERVEAAKELVKGEQFMDAITGETVPRRLRIVRALEDWAEKDAVKQAVAYLKDPDRPVRDRLTLMLVRVATLNADNLQESVNGIKDGDGNVRKACVAVLQALGQNDSAKGMALLKRALPDTPPDALAAAYAKRNAAVAGKIVEKVVALMKADGAARGTGGDVLAAFGDARGASVAALMPLLADKDDGICSGAASALGKIGDKAPVAELISAMGKRSAQVRRVAIGAVAMIADVSGEGALTEALNNPDDDNEARAQAAVGLGKIATPSAISILIRCLRDDDLKVQVASVSALARAGKPALGALFGALKDADARVRARAATALGGIAQPEVNSGLIASLGDQDASVRSEAATALGFAGNQGAVPALVAKLGGADGALAAACADALARIGEVARPALLRAMDAGDASAYFAARSMAAQGNAAVPALAQGAGGSASRAKWATVALGQIGGADSVAELRKLATSTDPRVRTDAQTTLDRVLLE